MKRERVTHVAMLLAGTLCPVCGMTAFAQDRPAGNSSATFPIDQAAPNPSAPFRFTTPIATPIGRTPTSAAGRVGQRLSETQVAPNAKPLGRIESRIQNRVQNRIRNRIDRTYDPQANAIAPFATAEEQAKAQTPKP